MSIVKRFTPHGGEPGTLAALDMLENLESYAAGIEDVAAGYTSASGFASVMYEFASEVKEVAETVSAIVRAERQRPGRTEVA